MKYERLKKMYDDKGIADQYPKALNAVKQLGQYLLEKDLTLESCQVNELELYMTHLIESNSNDLETLLALARYYYIYNLKTQYIFFTSVLGGIGVIDSIKKKCKNLTSLELMETPELGLTPKQLTGYTHQFMSELKVLEPKTYREILADNHHQLSEAAMLNEKAFYEASDSFEKYLKERHDRKVLELQQHCDENKVWYEQLITQETVDYVKDNQEILSGVLKDGYLYITKFPYNPDGVFSATNKRDRRYHYCHCPFAKESILSENPIDPEWCYCSAGFAKFPFEVILGKKLNVTCLESVLAGDPHCRFRIEMEGHE